MPCAAPICASSPPRLSVIGEAAAGIPSAAAGAGAGRAHLYRRTSFPPAAMPSSSRKNAERDGAKVRIRNGDSTAATSGRAALDFSAGAPLLAGGRRLGPREVSLAAAMGYGQLSVRRRPRLALVSTGDELVAPGQTPGRAQIVSSNHLGVAAMAEAAGAEWRFSASPATCRKALSPTSQRPRDADLSITIGGASVGDHDLVAPVLDRAGHGAVVSGRSPCGPASR